MYFLTTAAAGLWKRFAGQLGLGFCSASDKKKMPFVPMKVSAYDSTTFLDKKCIAFVILNNHLV
jgi:hypothetical protein